MQLSKPYQLDAQTRAGNMARLQAVLARIERELQGARWIVHEPFGRNLDAEMDRWLYVGDSTNGPADVRGLRQQHRRGQCAAL